MTTVKSKNPKLKKNKVILTPLESVRLDELRRLIKDSETVSEAKFYKDNIAALLSRGRLRALRAKTKTHKEK